MRILPDGTVEIRNKRTGETKIVSPNDLPSYNIPYSKYATELEAFQKVQKPEEIGKTEEQKKEPEEFKTITEAAKKVVSILDKYKGKEEEITGPYAAARSGIAPYLKEKTPEIDELNTAISMVNRAAAFREAGKVLSPTEMKILRGGIPSVSDPAGRIRTKLAGLLDYYGKYEEEKVAQAVTEPTPTPTQALGRQIPMMARQLPQQPITEVGLGMERLAGVQEKLGKSQLLPLLYGLGGRAALPIPGVGTGLGAGVGQYLKQALVRGGPEALVPTLKESKQIAKTGLTAGLLDLILSPKRAVGFGRQVLAKKGGVTVEGSDLAKGIIERAKASPTEVPITQRRAILKFAKQAEEVLKDKKFSIPELLKAKSTAWGKGYTLADKAGRPAAATFERIIGSTIKETIKKVKPSVTQMDKLLSLILKGQKTVGKAAWRFGPVAIGGELVRRGILGAFSGQGE